MGVSVSTIALLNQVPQLQLLQKLITITTYEFEFSWASKI